MKRKLILLIITVLVFNCFASCKTEETPDITANNGFGDSAEQTEITENELLEEEFSVSSSEQDQESEDGFDYGYEIPDDVLKRIEKLSGSRAEQAKALFQITEEEEKECSEAFANLPEKLPPIERIAGYNDPNLSEEVVIDTLVANKNAVWLMGDFGIQDQHICRLWEYYPKNWIIDHDFESVLPPNGHRVYYAPALDTEAEFDEYFSHIWTEETLDYNKKKYEVAEQNGRLTTISGDGRHSTMVDLRDSKVKDIVYNSDGSATAFVEEYAIDGLCVGIYDFVFVYSEKYGWRYHDDSAGTVVGVTAYSDKFRPIMTEKLAFDLIYEAKEASQRLVNFGFLGDTSEWYGDESNYIHRLAKDQPHDLMSYKSLVRFIPELDTTVEFYNYFSKIFTYTTLDKAQEYISFRVFDDKVYGTGINPCRNPNVDWNRSRVLSIEQNDKDGFARVEFRTFIEEPIYNPGIYEEAVYTFDFAFSNNFGWRLDTERALMPWYNYADMVFLEKEIDSEEFSEKMPVTMPELRRTEGYKDHMLTLEVAEGIIYEAKRLFEMAKYSGLSEDCYSWERNINNRVPHPNEPREFDTVKYLDGDCYLVKFIPALGTMEKFDAYFSRVVTSDTLESIKQYFDICEYNGALAGVNVLERPIDLSINHSADEVAYFEQNGDTAVLGINKYDSVSATKEEAFFGCWKYIFEYTEEYGWRLSVDNVGYTLLGL